MDASGIRKVFDMAAGVEGVTDLSIGQPDFDVPAPALDAVKRALDAGLTRYTPSPGLPELRRAVRRRCSEVSGFEPEDVVITCGASGGLTLALLALLDPGDEALVPDPFFVSYRQLVLACGARPVFCDTYPGFRLRREALERAATDRARLLILNSPANPTGAVLSEVEVREACAFARERGMAVISDEVYDTFWYSSPPVSPARFHDDVITVGGWSKSHAMTGLRIGWAAGPGEAISQMVKLQQFTFVCAPAPVQHAVLETIALDTEPVRRAYMAKRDLACSILKEGFGLVEPEGAFYAFPEAPGADGSAFARAALDGKVLVIPGGVFSARDTHFRLSFAAPDERVERGCRALVEIARGGV
jgi:aspartate aminotransferase/aminotransferase